VSVFGRPPVRGRLTPASPLGEGVRTDRPTQAPVSAGVGLQLPQHKDPCCVQWFAVQRAICDIDEADPLPLTPRQRSINP
jgi:hypothetical protein